MQRSGLSGGLNDLGLSPGGEGTPLRAPARALLRKRLELEQTGMGDDRHQPLKLSRQCLPRSEDALASSLGPEWSPSNLFLDHSAAPSQPQEDRRGRAGGAQAPKPYSVGDTAAWFGRQGTPASSAAARRPASPLVAKQPLARAHHASPATQPAAAHHTPSASSSALVLSPQTEGSIRALVGSEEVQTWVDEGTPQPKATTRLARVQMEARLHGRDSRLKSWKYSQGDELLGAWCDNVWFSADEIRRAAASGVPDG